MLEFHRLYPEEREAYQALLQASDPRGCEYSFGNLCLWGRQQVAFLDGCVAFVCKMPEGTRYPYPMGPGNRRQALEAVLAHAHGHCHLTGLTEGDCRELEAWFPGRFSISAHRDSWDYVYSIQELSDLPGRKFQKKRNHLHRFRAAHPHCRVEPLGSGNLSQAQQMVNHWYVRRKQRHPQGDYLPEAIAITRAFQSFDALGLTGIALVEAGEILGLTMASPMGRDTYDVHFEKAREEIPGAYAAVNQALAQYLRERNPEIQFLNREDDLGLEGLRRAKLSYHPHHLVEKFQAREKETHNGD